MNWSAPELVIGTLASWLSPLELLPWHPSPGSRSSAQEVHAPYTPAAARPVTKYPAHSSQRSRPPLVPAAFILIGASSKGLLALVSPDRTCKEMPLPALTPTLTTTAFDRSSLEWFEARSWKPASKGLPSSLTQLMHAQVSFSFRNLLIRALRHTSAFV